MVLSLQQTKKELIQLVCGNYAAELSACNTNEDLKQASIDVIRIITQKAQIGGQVEAVGQPQDLIKQILGSDFVNKMSQKCNAFAAWNANQAKAIEEDIKKSESKKEDLVSIREQLKKLQAQHVS